MAACLQPCNQVHQFTCSHALKTCWFLLALLGSANMCILMGWSSCRRFEQRLVTNWRQVQLNAAWQRLYSQTDEAMQVPQCSDTTMKAATAALISHTPNSSAVRTVSLGPSLGIETRKTLA